MSKDTLPPLLPLRVLEACARHESFAKAADELGVTPGAITQQIRVIETWVGAPLFRRTGRKVLLTNPTLAAKSGKKFVDLIAEICAVVPGPVKAGHD